MLCCHFDVLSILWLCDACRRREFDKSCCERRDLFGAEGALQTYTIIGRDLWATIRVYVSTRDLDDARRHRGFSWSHAMNLLNENRRCEDGIPSSVHGNILAEETVPSAVQLHADRPFFRPLECPLIAPPFAAGSVCSWFTVPAGHCSSGFADSGMVLCVAAALGGVWTLPCATLEDGRPVAGVMNFAPQFYFMEASSPASPRT
ncbi:surface protease GP63 [Trypanosoma cruzi]|nr:surface protease GP63 [Trypanosoma cruzi]